MAIQILDLRLAEVCLECGKPSLEPPLSTSPRVPETGTEESWVHKKCLRAWMDKEGKPEPEIPEAVKDLLLEEYSFDGIGFILPPEISVAAAGWNVTHNKTVLEAYRRGRQSNIGRS